MGLIEKNRSPLKQNQEYIWFADYGNKVIYEFDNSLKETSFYDIEQDKVINYGLLGNGIRMSFRKNSGTFLLSGRDYPVSIEINGEKIDLNQQDKKLVHFKMAHTDGLFVGGQREVLRYERAIDGYFFGYRFNIQDKYIQIVFGIPVVGQDRRPFFGIKVSSGSAADISIKIGDKETSFELTENKTETTNLYLF